MCDTWLLSTQKTQATYQRTRDSCSPLPLPSAWSPWDEHLLYIRVGVSIRENIWVLLPEDMAHSAAGDNL